MSNIHTSTEDPVHVDEGGHQVVLHPTDNDLFVRTGRQVIEACQLSIGIHVWLEELKEMLAFVERWCVQREAQIAGCVAEGRGSKVLILFIPRGDTFNFDLASELAVLNRQLVTTFNIGYVELGQIPSSDLHRFVDPEKARNIYGQSNATYGAVAAQPNPFVGHSDIPS